MGTVKLQGIVIGERIQGESNKQIVVLAKGVGRVLLSARGARKAKSKLLAAAQLFCYADFVAYEGRGFYSVTQAELLNSFYALRTDMEKLAEAVYLAELTDRTCPEGTEQDEILALLYYALTVMEKGILPPQMVSRIFELKLLQISGFFAPPVCAVCGSEDGRLFFDWQEGAFLCEKHPTRPAVSFCMALYAAQQPLFWGMRYGRYLASTLPLTRSSSWKTFWEDTWRYIWG